jgi:hypothetical protein
VNVAVRPRISEVGRLKFRESRRCGDAGCDQVIRPSLGQELGSVRSRGRLPSSLEPPGLSRSPGPKGPGKQSNASDLRSGKTTR